MHRRCRLAREQIFGEFLEAWEANALFDDLIAALPARLPVISPDDP
jgi:hypothetical protein